MCPKVLLVPPVVYDLPCKDPNPVQPLALQMRLSPRESDLSRSYNHCRTGRNRGGGIQSQTRGPCPTSLPLLQWPGSPSSSAYPRAGLSRLSPESPASPRPLQWKLVAGAVLLTHGQGLGACKGGTPAALALGSLPMTFACPTVFSTPPSGLQ